MKIIADRNIPFASEAFLNLGKVELLPGRDIEKDNIVDADVLLVRTVTRVDRKLLDGTDVKFVGTATIGFDHVDTTYLEDNSIGFSYAPGCNANSVSEYIIAAFLNLAQKLKFPLRGKKAGIIGCGNVGSRVVEKLKVLEMETLENDPPLFDQTGDTRYVPLERILEESDFITVHTPLSEIGKYPTFHLCDDDFFSRASKKPCFINSSRGGVCDTGSLTRALKSGDISAAVLDVWENEPDIDTRLLHLLTIGTPHIAGYSLDGKVNATKMLFNAVCRHFNIKNEWAPSLMPEPENPVISLKPSGDPENVIGEAVEIAYNIGSDDKMLRKLADYPTGQKQEFFDSLRNEYPVRREFSSYTVTGKYSRTGVFEKLEKLGFKTKTGGGCLNV